MFRRLEKWFDRVSDDWNPITVRDLRRLSRSLFFTVATIVHLGLLTLMHVVAIKDPYIPEEVFETVFRVIPTAMAMLAVSLLTLRRFVHARLADGLFDVVPLTPKEHVHGVLGTSSLLSAFFLVQALPFLAFPSILPFPYSIPVRLGILVVYFIIAQMASLFLLAFCIRVKTNIEAFITIFATIYLGGLSIEGPFVGMLIIWNEVLHLPPLMKPSLPFMVVASLGGILMVFSFVYLCYRLSLYHFGNRSESCWVATGNNLLYLAVWSSCWAGAAFVVSLCFAE